MTAWFVDVSVFVPFQCCLKKPKEGENLQRSWKLVLNGSGTEGLWFPFVLCCVLFWASSALSAWVERCLIFLGKLNYLTFQQHFNSVCFPIGPPPRTANCSTWANFSVPSRTCTRNLLTKLKINFISDCKQGKGALRIWGKRVS